MPIDFNGGNFVFLDGAAGTMLQKRGLKPGHRPDIMNISAPEAVGEVQRLYLDAGSEIIYTNTFGANAIALRETGYTPGEIIAAAVAITKRACDGRAKVALDIGPLGGFIDPLGDMTFEKAYELFREQATAGEAAGADLTVIETMSDLTELKAAIIAVRDNTGLPVFASMTFDKSGRTFAGCLPECFAVTAERLGVSALGLNCSLEPAQMLEIAERIAKMTSLPLLIKPNAGLPDTETGLYEISPENFARQMTQYASLGARFIGGCCGTTPDYIKELRRAFEPLTPSRPPKTPGTFICSPSRFVDISNYTLSGTFSDTAPSYDAAVESVSKQAAKAAEVIELQIPDNPGDAARLITAAREITDKPAVIITGSAKALDGALRVTGGIPAVYITGEIIKTAEKYGAVILNQGIF